MKSRKVGKALEEAIAAEPSELKPIKSKAHLMNPIRREIFQYLCRYPCSTISKIAHGVKRSIHTVDWHLKRLIEGRYVLMNREASTDIYLPNGLLDPKDLAILSTLNNRRVRDVFIEILDNPGSTQREISSDLKMSHQSIGRATGNLEKLGLINIVDDGKFKRYYPSELLVVKREGNYERTKRFRQGILNRLESEGLKPNVMRATDTALMIRISSGKEKASLLLICDPFASVLV